MYFRMIEKAKIPEFPDFLIDSATTTVNIPTY